MSSAPRTHDTCLHTPCPQFDMPTSIILSSHKKRLSCHTKLPQRIRFGWSLHFFKQNQFRLFKAWCCFRYVGKTITRHVVDRAISLKHLKSWPILPQTCMFSMAPAFIHKQFVATLRYLWAYLVPIHSQTEIQTCSQLAGAFSTWFPLF
jgi:hypothetical protein